MNATPGRWPIATVIEHFSGWSENDLRNAIWHISEGRAVRGVYQPDVEELRQVLRSRGLSDRGYHEGE